MRKMRTIAGLLSMVALFLLVAGCAKPAAEVKPTLYPQIVISPASGPVAAKVTVSGSGFAPEEEVKLSMTVLESVEWSFGTEKGKIMANKDGAFVVSATMPAEGLTADQAYTVRVEGLKSGAMATYPFLIIKKK